MKNSIFKGKSTRTKVFSVITIVGICLILCLNLVLTHFCEQKLFFVDLTPEEFYTLSDTMVEVCDEMFAPDENGNKKEIKITFCTDPDYLIGSDDMRATYFMALALQNKYDNVTVETVNAALDPTAVSAYKTTSRDTISNTDVIVSYGAKYRIVNAAGFWTTYSQNEGYFSYNGEYRMASILASITAIYQPVAYFVTNHGETYYDPANPDSQNSKDTGYLADLLTERGLKIKTIDLSDPSIKRIPDDCVLLIINNPTNDFTYDEDRLDEFNYVSETEMLDRYLVRDYGSIIINKAHDVDLPCLERFVSEWGIGFGDEQVYDPDKALFGGSSSDSDNSKFAGVYDSNDENFGYAYYGAYSTLSSAPQMVFNNTGYVYCTFDSGEAMIEPGNIQGSRDYAAFIGTSENAYNYVGSATVTSEKTLIAAGIRSNLDAYTGERVSSYVFCTNSGDFFSNELLGNPSYANYDIMASVISNISRTDKYATTDLGGLTTNSSTVGGKQCVSTTLSDTPKEVLSPDLHSIVRVNKGLGKGAIVAYTIIAMVPAVAALTLGIIVTIKRKFL